MKKIFVSGCYDILHAGHIQFLKDAKRLGGHLTVCFASPEVLRVAKHRTPSLPSEHKQKLLESLSFVDAVVTSSDTHPIFDFARHIKKFRPHILATTEDDRHIEEKRAFCKRHGMELVVLPKRAPRTPISTTSIISRLTNTATVPLRVDFAGGWLDVPKLARKNGYVVNCAIQPLVSLVDWGYEKQSGLGGSAAHALLKAQNAVTSELALGVGWQDPAILTETGLCVWKSGPRPVLDLKANPDWLKGKMLLYWTGKSHHTPGLTDMKRNYTDIVRAGALARTAVQKSDFKMLARATALSYQTQLDEGMEPLPTIPGASASKYAGGGHGGYALYLFDTKAARNRAARRKDTKIIEPYLRATDTLT